MRLFAPDTDVPVTSGAVCSSSVKSRLKSGSLWIALSLTVCDAPMCDCASTGLCAFTTTSAQPRRRMREHEVHGVALAEARA